jgi:uncharacterized protein YecE (DUF72 family)
MDEQLPLFPPPQPRKPRREAAPAVGPAVVGHEIGELARQLPRALHLGTSSWYFPGWRGIVWDRAASESTLARHGLAAYARHPLLTGVGIDRSFYAPLSAAQYAAYARQVPAHFRFTVKAPAACTTPWLRAEAGARPAANAHYLDPGHAVERFVRPCLEGLGDKAGPLVFQFPPQGRARLRSPERFASALRAFLKQLPAGPLYAVEVRDPELLTRALSAALRDAGARYCLGLHARMPAVAAQAAAAAGAGAGPLVARWNLHAGYGYEQAKARYAPFDRLVDEDPATRESLARLAAAALGAGQAVYITVNNKAEGSAPLSVIKLAQAIAAALKAR